jgi:muramoyltetrapeptide carboxypeptidase
MIFALSRETEFGLQTHFMHSLQIPRALPDSGRIAVLAISSPSTPERIEQGGRWLEQRGYSVVYADNLYDRQRYLAGSDDHRLREINRALNDPSIDAFCFARGGYGAMRILDRIDYAAIAARPRPIIGYSDLTALHQACATRIDLSTFHGPMLNLDLFEGLSPLQERWFFDILRGEAPLAYEFQSSQIIADGSAEGILFGGCLSLTNALLGTPYDYWPENGIWFWEDVSESTYRIDRMLTTLRLSGRLQSIRGVIIGRLKDCGGNDPKELDDLLFEFFASASIPVVRDFPFGHFGDNLLLPVGAKAKLDTRSRTLVFPEPLVDRSLP